MKKLWLAFLALLCCAALAMPVHADIPAPRETLLSPDGGLYYVIAVLVLAAGFVLYLLLHKRNK